MEKECVKQNNEAKLFKDVRTALTKIEYLEKKVAYLEKIVDELAVDVSAIYVAAGAALAVDELAVDVSEVRI